MLEAVKISKTYKPKRGVPVKALDGVSLKFPDRGMVFLLGKSGSGKSTLLNLLGGLDRYDSDGGEIIINGVSSRNFSQQHFDSYRNAYVGFIFQEYNILDEFTVGANIGLALELQGKRADDGEINRILHEVDLDGYGSRRPNELSGGQKQRVAIARALVKNPEIIMADEPTGALDSNTGKQVFDTLKRLSRDKLVIIVSHDRDFSEKYADRIIELADGHVISDVEYDGTASTEAKPVYEGDTVTLPSGYQLTEEDRLAINEYIRNLASGRAAAITVSKENAKNFRKTDESKIAGDADAVFRPIKSRLPLKPAFRIGASSLKHKKIRLTVTILLSLVAFTLFGIADTFAAYDRINACTASLIDSNVRHASFRKKVRQGTGNDTYYRQGYKMTDDDLKEITRRTGIAVSGVYTRKDGNTLGFSENLGSGKNAPLNVRNATGIITGTEKTVSGLGCRIVAGRYPENNNEIAITSFLFDTFRRCGYRVYGAAEEVTVGAPEDILGKTVRLGALDATVTAVIDTGFDRERYSVLGEPTENLEPAELIRYYVLSNEFDTELDYGLIGLLFTADGFLDNFRKVNFDLSKTNFYIDGYWEDKSYLAVSVNAAVTPDAVDTSSVIWLDGEKTELADGEVIISDGDFRIGTGDGKESYGVSAEEAAEFLRGKDSMDFSPFLFEENRNVDLKVVGVIDSGALSVSDGINAFVVCNEKTAGILCGTESGSYTTAIGSMPETAAGIRKIVVSSYDESMDVLYTVNSPVIFELDSITGVLSVLAKVFLYIGIGFAVFASLMLSNFISTSIAYKKQEIGILRAIGARSNDVFRIFFSESFIIAMTNFVLSAIATGTVTAVINANLRRSTGILITLLSFSLRQVALLLVISIGVAFIASFLPVRKIAAKKPIDAIRNR